MKYDDLMNTITEIINNELIYKKGLKLVYELDSETHYKLEEHIFYSRQIEGEFTPSDDVFELEVDGVVVQIKRKE